MLFDKTLIVLFAASLGSSYTQALPTENKPEIIQKSQIHDEAPVEMEVDAKQDNGSGSETLEIKNVGPEMEKAIIMGSNANTKINDIIHSIHKSEQPSHHSKNGASVDNWPDMSRLMNMNLDDLLSFTADSMQSGRNKFINTVNTDFWKPDAKRMTIAKTQWDDFFGSDGVDSKVDRKQPNDDETIVESKTTSVKLDDEEERSTESASNTSSSVAEVNLLNHFGGVNQSDSENNLHNRSIVISKDSDLKNKTEPGTKSMKIDDEFKVALESAVRSALTNIINELFVDIARDFVQRHASKESIVKSESRSL